MELEAQVLSTIEEYDMIPPGTRVLAGVSGGADSVCLLVLLSHLLRRGKLRFQLRAVHVHHGLRESAEEDLRFVQRLCGELGVELAVCRVDAAGEAARRGMSIEEAGRLLRRRAFRKVCAAWDQEVRAPGGSDQEEPSGEGPERAAINAEEEAAGGGCPPAEGKEDSPEAPPCRVALAHHMEDSAETLLFNLCRGSGMEGLSGIRPLTAAEDMNPAGCIIRPLIRSSRADIETWLTRQGRSWREDETNEDVRFTRNYLRKDIFPSLEQNVNARSAEHMARAALELSEAETYLREETERRRKACLILTEPVNNADLQGDREVLSISRLKGNPLFWRRRIVYEALVRAYAEAGLGNPSKDLTSAHVGALLRLLDTPGSAGIDLPRGMRARKEYDELRFMSGDGAPLPESADRYALRIFAWREGMEIPTGPCTKWIDYDTITQSLSLRTRRGGDVIALEPDGQGGFHCKKLARVMIDRKIPERMRDSIVLPMDAGHVVWFPGYRIGADYRITENTRTVLELRLVPAGDEEG